MWQRYEREVGLIMKVEKRKMANYELTHISERYHLSKGIYKISLIKFAGNIYYPTPWEIYQIGGKQRLFEDVERFSKKSDALYAAERYLNQSKFELWFKRFWSRLRGCKDGY